jgi:hypothetical protein
LDYIVSLEEQLVTLKAYVRDMERRNLESSNDLSSKKVSPYLDDEYRLAREVQKDQHLDSRADASLNLTEDHDHRSTSAIDDVGSLMWKMSISDKGNTMFIGPSGNFCFTTTSNTANLKTREPQVSSSIVYNGLYATYIQDEELKKELLELFMTSINTFHHFVYPVSIDVIFDVDDSISTFLHCAILAAGSRLSRRENAKEVGDAFALHAESLALICCREDPCLIVAQALTIMCWRELSLENENMAWMYNCEFEKNRMLSTTIY